MKQLQFILIIICLGIFLFPKDNFYAEASQENCCRTGTENKSCCEKNKDSGHHTSKNNTKDSKSSCSDDCCSFCMTCHTFIENVFPKNTFSGLPLFKADKNLIFPYSDPYISDRLKDIWQPPKLG